MRGTIRRLLGGEPIRHVFAFLLFHNANEGVLSRLPGRRTTPMQRILGDLLFICCSKNRNAALHQVFPSILILEAEATGFRLWQSRVSEQQGSRRRVLAVLISREDKKVCGTLWNGAILRDLQVQVCAESTDLSKQQLFPLGTLELGHVALAPVDSISVHVKVISSLVDLHFTTQLVLVHIGVLKAQGCLFGGLARTEVSLLVSFSLARALRAIF
mmetsp:Transcript_85530/g.135643  ORF Transcript_85530/g.135643 Transcript_85530/m.135643 type:complete len:215 (-) Transcript_85530:858-1502(-)